MKSLITNLYTQAMKKTLKSLVTLGLLAYWSTKAYSAIDLSGWLPSPSCTTLAQTLEVDTIPKVSLVAVLGSSSNVPPELAKEYENAYKLLISNANAKWTGVKNPKSSIQETDSSMIVIQIIYGNFIVPSDGQLLRLGVERVVTADGKVEVRVWNFKGAKGTPATMKEVLLLQHHAQQFVWEYEKKKGLGYTGIGTITKNTLPNT